MHSDGKQTKEFNIEMEYSPEAQLHSDNFDKH